MPKRKAKSKPRDIGADAYGHQDASNPTRPEVGTQARFNLREKPKKYRYDSSLAPSLEWDANPAREQAETLIRRILDADSLDDAKAAAEKLRRMSAPFLNWAGKAETQAFDVPTLPLFIHERLSTAAILEALRAHRRDKQKTLFDLFADPQHAIVDQLRAYEHRDPWVNRLLLGDSLMVMNSLLHLEKLAGQVQMIYMDPPYGVKFGSNFQPFVRKRDVKNNDDADMTREPEMVQAFRDTWELGLHSYLTYLHERLLLCRELLHPSGSVFVQISDENVHHVREVMDEVFGAENFVSIVAFTTTSGFETRALPRAGDYLLWYAKDREQIKYRTIFVPAEREIGEDGYRWIQLHDNSARALTAAEIRGEETFPNNARVYKPDNIISQGAASEPQPFNYKGKTYEPPPNSHWKANYPDGMNRLAASNRLHVSRNTIQYIRFADDFPWRDLTNIWTDTVTGQFTDIKTYIVQTNVKVLQRCLLMTTDPGDLVLDPTCGSGTTAYVAEQWGRRWISIDTSRVPLALARQRLLTATFPWYDLKDEAHGPAGGFVYQRKQNKRGEEIGGIVPHVTLKSIANNEPPDEEVLVDRPEVVKDIVRVTGPFTVEAIIAPATTPSPPTPLPLSTGGEGSKSAPRPLGGEGLGVRGYAERMLEVLRRSPRLHLPGNRGIEFAAARVPARAQWLSAEATLSGDNSEAVAVVFGPEHAAVNDRLVYNAAMEAHAKQYAHLVVVGFAIEANARRLIDSCSELCGIAATYVQATMDLLMGDLLKNMKSSQILSVCGSPEIALRRLPAVKGETTKYQVELLGLDVFDPVSMEVDHRDGGDVPAWFLCGDYNDRVFHVTQAFFPRTSAWDNLKRSLKGVYDDSLWQHLAGTISAPFEAGEYEQIAVKVIDDRGNELMVVRKLDEAEK